ncbi:MAG: serine/threonine protein phosphatase [Clostridiales bacterium]|nr:serine/threonine protein phosphatase [Clostridiales bacterium]
MRTIIIGDVHGCDRTLQDLIERVRPEAGKDRLVFLGDLFDRGPDSFQVFQTIQLLDDSFGEDCILLLGNHEDYLLQPKLTKQQRIIWEHVGRQATVSSFEKHGARMEDSIPWIKGHISLFWKTDIFQCVHAGIMVDPPEVNDLETLVHSHETVLMNRYAGPLTITGHIALERATWFAGDGETTEELQENKTLQLPETGVICIDTGCGKGGRLTAMVIEENRFTLQSVQESM